MEELINRVMQIELFFRFLKRTMGGIHLVRHDRAGTTIQFYVMMTLALLKNKKSVFFN
jgi:hypothetical protein